MIWGEWAGKSRLLKRLETMTQPCAISTDLNTLKSTLDLTRILKTWDSSYHSIRSYTRHSQRVCIPSFCLTSFYQFSFIVSFTYFTPFWCINLLIHLVLWLAQRCPSQPCVWETYSSIFLEYWFLIISFLFSYDL